MTVLNKGALAVVCADPSPAYEGSADIALDCVASGALAGSTYDYVWAARGDTPDTALLIAGIDGPATTFAVPEEVAADTDYEYTLTVSAANTESGSAEVTVTVLNKGALAVVCADPSPAYEGAADFDLDCSASGAPAGSTYDYVWAARDDTPDTALLIAGIDGPAPTFSAPAALDATTTYEYLLTVSAEHAESGSAEVTVTVLNKGALAVVCADPSPAYEGAADFALDCDGFGRSCGFYVRLRLDGSGRHAGHGAAYSGHGRSRADVRRAGRGGRDDDVRVPAYGFGGACRVRFGGGNGDGAEQGRARRGLRGSLSGVRRRGGFRAGLRRLRARLRVLRVRRTSGRLGASTPDTALLIAGNGRSRADVRGAGRGGRDDDVRVPAYGLGGECGVPVRRR